MMSDQPQGSNVPKVASEGLQQSLARQAEEAWKVAHYEREQRDAHTSKIRFGLVGFNAASLVGISTIGVTFGTLAPKTMLMAGAYFFVGLVSAGLSLLIHQNYMDAQKAAAFVKATTVSAAAWLALQPFSQSSEERFSTALDAAHQAEEPDARWNKWSIFPQYLSAACLVGGMVTIGVGALRSQHLSVLDLFR
jgi:hypothetical protein